MRNAFAHEELQVGGKLTWSKSLTDRGRREEEERSEDINKQILYAVSQGLRTQF